MLTAFMAATIVGFFEDALPSMLSLSHLCPSQGRKYGNSNPYRGYTRYRIGRDPIFHRLDAIGKEVSVGLTIGILVGLLTATIAFLWKGNPMLGGAILAMI